MSKPYSYHFSGTRGQLLGIIQSLPPNPDDLLSRGWRELPRSHVPGGRFFRDKETGLIVRFDEGEERQSGFAKRDHYHVYNFDGNNRHDMYLDADGTPVGKGSAASHIIPGEV